MATLYIISGCNGAGKTTASFTILPEIFDCTEFLNADEIARGLSPFNPETVAILSARIMIERIDHLIESEVDFAIETTLTSISFLQTIKKAKEKRYRVVLIYFWLANVELAIERVKNRVIEGGHNIPSPVIKRRYSKGIFNLICKFIPVVDNWIIIDNSSKPFNFVAEGEIFENVIVYNKETWHKINTYAKR